MTKKQLIESMLEIEFLLNSLADVADEIDSDCIGGKDEKDEKDD